MNGETQVVEAGRCNAKLRSGRRCRQVAGHGTSHTGYGQCKFHGGSTPNGTKYAAKLEARARYCGPWEALNIDAEDSLEESVNASAALLAFMASELKRAQRDGADARELRVIQAGYAEALERNVRVAATVAKLKLDSRDTASRERAAEGFAAALQAVAERLQLSDQQRAMLPEAIRTGLPAVIDGTAEERARDKLPPAIRNGRRP